MTYLYSKKNNKPRADVNSHTFTPTTQVPEPSESAGSGFFISKSTKTDKGVPSSLTSPETQTIDNSADYIQLADEFIDQCVYEWATWLAQTELKSAQLQSTSNREKNRFHRWLKEYKEATT